MAAGDELRRVLVYRTTLGAPSEPWLFTQHAQVPGWTTSYLTHLVEGGGRFVHEWARERVIESTWGPRRMRQAAFLRGWDPVANRAVEATDPAVIHAHFGPDGAFAARTASKHSVPLVVSFHGYDALRRDAAFTTPGGRMWLRHRAELFEQAALVLANSSIVREHLLDLGADPTRTFVHRLGVDLTRLRPIDDRPDDNVLFVGRLTDVKGIEIAIRAMAVVLTQYPSARFTVVGDGPLRSDMERLAHRLGVDVTWKGAVPFAEMCGELDRATIVLGPAITAADGQREAVGLSFVEAQACGIPVVASRSGGIPETVIDGVTGLLASEGSVEETAEQVVTLLGDRPRREALGRAGREHVMREFDLPTQSRRLAAHYDRIAR